MTFVDDVWLSEVGVPTTTVWSYPKVHGDVTVTANTAGVVTGTYSYDPYGTSLATLPDNAASDFDNGWLGTHQRPVEHGTGVVATIEMGARPYQSGLARFLSVDPVEGGTTTNDYGYVPDPVNQFDLDGQRCWTGVDHYETVVIGYGWRGEPLTASVQRCRGAGAARGARGAATAAGRAAVAADRFLVNSMCESAAFWDPLGVPGDDDQPGRASLATSTALSGAHFLLKGAGLQAGAAALGKATGMSASLGGAAFLLHGSCVLMGVT